MAPRGLRECVATFTVVMFGSTSYPAISAPGPDLIVAEIEAIVISKRQNGVSSILMTTISCNAGTEPAAWRQLPAVDHPVITQNLYRLAGGTMHQIGQSGVKHGYYAMQNTGLCPSRCDPWHGFPPGTKLGPGCADPYGGPLIDIEQYAGARNKINPTTAAFDGGTAASPGPATFGRELQVRDLDLQTPQARYFVEGQYIAADDTKTGNWRNNISYREIQVIPGATGWVFRAVGDTRRGCPAILAWEGATFTAYDPTADGRVIVGTKTTNVGGDKYRIEVAVYNMTSDRAVRGVSVPIAGWAVQPASITVSTPFVDGEGSSAETWAHTVTKDQIGWSTATFSENGTANALRWGQMFTFSFEATTPNAPKVDQVVIYPYKGTRAESQVVRLDGGLKCDPSAYR